MTSTQLSPQPPTTAPSPEPVPYHMALATTSPSPWRGIGAIITLVASIPLAGYPLMLAAGFLDSLIADPSLPPTPGPFFLVANFGALALLTPISMLLQRIFFGVPFRSLHSVTGKLRGKLLLRTVCWFVPLWAAQLGLATLISGGDNPPASTWNILQTTVAYLAVIMLTPLQSAGEEYGCRGLAMRAAASFGRGERSGLVIGLLVSSIVFAALHLSVDPWLNVYYLVFAVSAGIITWRTGGLEMAIVLHATNNVMLFLLALISGHDLMATLVPTPGSGTALLLIPGAVLVLVTAAVWWRTRGPVPTGAVPTRAGSAPVAR